jgi:hypothetical protein
MFRFHNWFKFVIIKLTVNNIRNNNIKIIPSKYYLHILSVNVQNDVNGRPIVTRVCCRYFRLNRHISSTSEHFRNTLTDSKVPVPRSTTQDTLISTDRVLLILPFSNSEHDFWFGRSHSLCRPTTSTDYVDRPLAHMSTNHSHSLCRLTTRKINSPRPLA